MMLSNCIKTEGMLSNTWHHTYFVAQAPYQSLFATLGSVFGCDNIFFGFQACNGIESIEKAKKCGLIWMLNAHGIT